MPVKLFIAVLFKEHAALEGAKELFVGQWGPIDFEGSDHVFDTTDYYEPEMGSPLLRRIVSFERLAEPAGLVDMKLSCNAIEDRLKTGGARTVNCDCGYLDHNKVVLASAKEAGQKILILTRGYMPTCRDGIRTAHTGLLNGRSLILKTAGTTRTWHG